MAKDGKGRFVAGGIAIKVEGDTSDLEKDMKRTSKGMATWSTALGNLIASGIQSAITGMVDIVKGGLELVGGIIATSVEDAISLESAFAGVIKTTEGLADEAGNLTAEGIEMQQAFRDLAEEIPQDVEVLMGLGALGAQLGIAEEGLVDFTRTMAMVGDATDLTSETAASAFAQISNVMNTPQSQIENMASALVALGNNMATTEPAIVSFAQRIAGAGEVVGLTEADVFGIAAAFSSVGIGAEAGGTAVQKVLLGMNEAMIAGGEKAKLFAKTTGLSVESFSTLWEKDAARAFQLFVGGLGAAGDDALGILDQLELKDQRLITAFLSLSGAGDVLSKSLELSNEAFAENTALQVEAEARYRTTESQIQLFKNTLRDLSFTLGGAVVPALNEMLEIAKPIIAEIGERLPGIIETHVVPAIKDAVAWIGQVISFIGDMDFGAMAEGIQTAFENIQSIVVPVFDAIVAFVQENFVPIFLKVIEIFQEFLPVAIAATVEFFNTFIVPAFEIVVAFVQDILIPAIETLVDIFQEVLPVAIQIATEYFETYIIPVFEALVEQWVTNIQPALAKLIEFLGEFIPEAVKQVGIVWDEVLQPAFAWLADILVTWIIPILGQLVTWLIENIPVALTALMTFWTETAWPAILNAITWFQENVAPIIEQIVLWLMENIPVALEELRRIWQDVVWPALLVAAEFFMEEILPIYLGLVEWFMVTLPDALENLRKTWVDDVWPVIEDVITIVAKVWDAIFEELGRWINDNIMPWVKVLGELWDTTWLAIQTQVELFWEVIEPIWLQIQEWLDVKLKKSTGDASTQWKEIWSGIQSAVETAWGILESIFDAIVKFIDKIASTTVSFKVGIPDLPDWAMPGSPLPIHSAWKDFEDWSKQATIEPVMNVGAIEDTTMSVLDRVQSERTMNVHEGDTFDLTANYPAQSEVDLITRVRRLQLESEVSVGAA